MSIYLHLFLTIFVLEDFKSILDGSLKLPIREINHLRLLDNPIKTLDKILVRRILLNIVIPVFLASEFDNKSVCYTTLSSVAKS